ncbi:MAG: hypothetical protein ABSH29_08960 [Acidimicrobiales bacterium]
MSDPTVMATLAALSTARRRRRPASRIPMRIGTGRRAESAIVHRARRGGLAASARALTVLVREARTAGTTVATMATAMAAPITIPKPMQNSLPSGSSMIVQLVPLPSWRATLRAPSPTSLSIS